MDLVLPHQPMGDYFAAYCGIEKAYQDGLARAIGVANFYPGPLTNLCENGQPSPLSIRWSCIPSLFSRGPSTI